MTSDDALAPLLAILAAKARKHMQERREADRVLAERLELRAALLRFGLPADGAAEAVAADDPSALACADRTRLEERVVRELGRLARFARSRDPRYDLNRHILLARLIRWLQGRQDWIRPAPSLTDRHGRQRPALTVQRKRKPSDKGGQKRGRRPKDGRRQPATARASITAGHALPKREG